MNSPYKYELKELVSREITVDRHGAPSLKGTLLEIKEGGCVLALPGPTSDSSNFVFVAYEDIRGVGRVDWDSQKIGK